MCQTFIDRYKAVKNQPSPCELFIEEIEKYLLSL